MSRIYRQAAFVVIDLGEAADDSDLVISLIERRGEWGEDKWGHGWRSLCCRPWFRRVWVLQEMVLASMVRMLCAEVVFKWVDLAAMVREMMWNGTKANIGPLALRGCQAIKSMDGLSYRRETKFVPPGAKVFDRRDSIVELLSLSRVRETTDPRDRVYGVMGLITSRALSGIDDYELKADYSITVEEVFEKVARDLLGKRGCVEMLYEACGPKNLSNLPS